ncbi:type II toxin-antitoxin system HicB family antitoxin [Sedimentibacter sp.]|uniref:type II toxin-antitoxin system HicB family antitoxin n=1 Tax=Sedimentibacter sp. TaxID=1960295 RepID=UPI0028A288CA|nr:type II toxin-antitoxin system HicB family antitoxin [Sedimentibacter sp.]
MKKLFYPAIFQTEDNNAFSVFFPDIEGCNTCGESMEDAYEMAIDALGLMLSYMEDNNMEIPMASKPQDIVLEKNQYLVIVEFDMLAYKKKHRSQAVKKTLSIPSWLNDIAIENNVNFSQILQDALINTLNIK